MTAEPSFTWSQARHWLSGLPDGGGLNIAHEAVDRHVQGGRGDAVALRYLPRRGPAQDVTYADLAERTSRFANVLRELGVRSGERVFVLCGRTPDLYVAVLGSLKARAVVCPLFSAFGPEPIRQRLEIGDARVLVTTAELYERRIAAQRSQFPRLAHVLVLDDPAPPDTLPLGQLLSEASPCFSIPSTHPEDPALLHFTSGTTGTPKGALHVHDAVVTHHATGRLVLGLLEGDRFWCTADPGWVTGTSYGIVAPLTCGVTAVVDEGDFDAERWYRILDSESVDVWYTAPTAIRMLMRAGAELAAATDLSRVRFAASVGEPLDPKAIEWGRKMLGLTFHDNWWQTETGGIMVANTADLPVRPGSMGKPIPGVTAAVLSCDDEGHLVRAPDGSPTVLGGDEVTGMLALAVGWPSMFRAYVGQEDRYRACFADGWYLTGDLVRRDAEGYFWFVARADDVIKSAGHLIGPFEVEAALLTHPSVAEAGVFGVPDPVAGAIVHAAVVLKPDVHSRPQQVVKDIMALARRRLGPAVAPRQITVVDEIPKTRSGKILRRLLRARELGLAEGDLSTLEPAPTGPGVS